MIRPLDEKNSQTNLVRGISGTRLGPSAERRGLAQPLGPLVRSLLAWDLVRQTAPGRWELAPSVQRRLEEASQARPTEKAVVPAIGLHCEGCGVMDLTWRTNGLRLCQACLESTPRDSRPPGTRSVPGPSVAAPELPGAS